MRFAPTVSTIFNNQPFDGQGVSLYVTVGSSVVYRNKRVMAGEILNGPTIGFGDSSVLKTARYLGATSPVAAISTPSIADWLSQTIAVNVRTYKDDVENESIDFRLITLDGSGDEVAAIEGVATLLTTEERDGGVMRIRFVWEPSDTGLQPTTFTAIRTAGPTSPSNVVYSAGTGRQLITIETPALSDASAYTYKIQAASGVSTLDVLTGITVDADATGPTAPTVTAVEW